jgi:signal peptidase I
VDPSPPRAAPTGTQLEPEPEAEAPRSSVRTAVEWVVIVVAALLTALLIKTFLLQAFYIPSDSMTPTLVQHDRVLVNKLSYHFHDVHRGDIVVFERPPGEVDPKIKDLIKRVIGLPGETVQGHDGHVFINGQQLIEPYLPAGVATSDFPAITIAKDHVWVMGDNRPGSADSRSFGMVDEDTIVGRAIVKAWPPWDASFL